MSMGWMTQVASIPEAPPLTKGLIVFQTPVAATAVCGCCFASAISLPLPDRAALRCAVLGSGEGAERTRAARGRVREMEQGRRRLPRSLGGVALY
jgi:hypothetical protein